MQKEKTIFEKFFLLEIFKISFVVKMDFEHF